MAGFSSMSVIGAIAITMAGVSAVQLEKMDHMPPGWSNVGPASTSTPISLQIGLSLSNLDLLDSKLTNVSTPGHADYGKYLDSDDVSNFFAPAAHAQAAVMTWLEKNNITNATFDGHWINVITDIDAANSLLNATYNKYVDGNGNNKIRTPHYHVPDELAEHVDLITPTVYLGSVRAEAKVQMHGPYPMIKNDVAPFPKRDEHPSESHSKRTLLSTPTGLSNVTNCSAYITPSCLKDMYNVGNYTPDATCGSRVGFGSFLNNSASYTDLASFLETFDLPRVNLTTQIFENGINTPQYPGDEANLDSQYLSALSGGLPITEIIVGGISYAIPDIDQPAPENYNEPWVPYYQNLLKMSNAELPQVISQSYGDEEQTVPYRYAKRVCRMIGMLGLRGITVINSSGDSGVGAACRSNTNNQTRFTPEFPSTCPYVTSVGGTQSYNPEVAWTGSGGGFSDYFQQPLYQKEAVTKYLTFGLDPTSKALYGEYANYTGRAIPDVAAHSLSPALTFVFTGYAGEIGGTSASAPIFAGIVGLLNDVRFRAGKPAMGFLNPWLYAIGHMGLTDITTGGSTGCAGYDSRTGHGVEGGGIVPGAAWNATAGWDPVTGWGVPNFEKLQKLALWY